MDWGMVIAQEIRRYTAAEYLELDRKAEVKSEFFDGEMFSMAGGSPRHSLIIANVIGHLRDLLKGKPCRTYDSNLRLHVPATGLYTYPDALVICGELLLLEGTSDTVTNPTLLVEVLSPGTEGYSRGAHFLHYQSIPSFREYLLVSQHRPEIGHYVRQEDHSWRFTSVTGLAPLALASLKVELVLAEIYAGVQFDARKE